MNIPQSKFSLRYVRWTFLSFFVGILAGTSAAVFLILLDWATKTRDVHPSIIWGLPLIGFAIGWVYHHYGREVAPGSNLILDEIHDPKKVVPVRMAPLILVGTVLTHLFGGSVGREGTAVQMGASLADQLTHLFRIEREERKVLLVAGAGAGFGAAIGAPWAGVIFGMEVMNVGRLRLFAWFQCLIASFVGFYTAVFLKAPHSVFMRFELPQFHWKTLTYIALAGIVFGLTARLFSAFTHLVEKFQASIIRYSPLKPLLGGIVLVGLYWLEGSYRYVGLGISTIQGALQEPATFWEPIFKIGFTAVTIGSGFKGGEFVPLVFIGATLGSALGLILPISFQLLAAVGFAAVFAGAANTPIACSLMAIEIFGPQIAPYAVVGCFASYYFSGHHGIYKSQRLYMKKHKKLMSILGWLGELPRRFLNGERKEK